MTFLKINEKKIFLFLLPNIDIVKIFQIIIKHFAGNSAGKKRILLKTEVVAFILNLKKHQ
jgi:hypothetical protein